MMKCAMLKVSSALSCQVAVFASMPYCLYVTAHRVPNLSATRLIYVWLIKIAGDNEWKKTGCSLTSIA